METLDILIGVAGLVLVVGAVVYFMLRTSSKNEDTCKDLASYPGWEAVGSVPDDFKVKEKEEVRNVVQA